MKNNLCGYNLIIGNTLIDTYDDEEIAVSVMNEICRRIDKKVDFININELNNLLEA